jgi:hypothetical protein
VDLVNEFRPLSDEVDTRPKREETARARRRCCRAKIISGRSNWVQNKRIDREGSRRRRGRTRNRSGTRRRVARSFKGGATGDIQAVTNRSNIGNTELCVPTMLRRGGKLRRDARRGMTRITEDGSPNSGEVDTRHSGRSRDPDWAHHLWSQ